MAAKVINPKHKALAHSYVLDPVLVAAIIEQEPNVPTDNDVNLICKRLCRCIDACPYDEVSALALYNPRGESDFVARVLIAKLSYF
jgi:hypothetical protein